MTNQSYEGWYPECLVCGMGNLGPIVCLDPHDHADAVSARRILDGDGPEALIQDDDGHWWKRCRLCDRRVLSDPFAASIGLCAGCWNHSPERGQYPPSSAEELASVATERLPPAGRWRRRLRLSA